MVVTKLALVPPLGSGERSPGGPQGELKNSLFQFFSKVRKITFYSALPKVLHMGISYMGTWPYKFSIIELLNFFGFQYKMGNSQSISMLTYGVDDTVLPIDPLNVNFRNFIDNFTDIDDGLYVQDEELLSIVFNIIF